MKSKSLISLTSIAGAILLLNACATTTTGSNVARREPVAVQKVARLSADQDVLAQLMAGEFALADGNLELGAKHYATAAAASSDPSIAAQATRIALVARQWPTARASLNRWRELRADDPGLLQADAALAIAEGHVDVAVKHLEALLALPESKGWRLLGQALLSAPDPNVAGSVLERLAIAEKLVGQPEDLWIAMSQLAFKLERKPFARTLADATVKKFASANAIAWSAQLAADEGDKQRALELYAQAVKRAPDQNRLRASYALLLGEHGDNAGAARLLAQGKQDDYTYAARAAYAARANDKTLLQALYTELSGMPDSERSARSYLLGQIAELLDQDAAALKWYRQVAQDDGHWFESQVRVAVLIDEQGNRDAAMTMIHELQARVGDDAKRLGDVFLLEAELHARSERVAAALDAYARGLAVLPDDTRLLYARALLAANSGSTIDAERDLRRVLELKPGDTDAMNALGYTLADSNQKLGEALSLIELAMKTRPEEPAVIDSFGWVQYRLGNLGEAEKALRRAYAKQADAEIAAHLGEVLWQLGNRAEAREIWEQGRRKDEKNKALLETMRRLSP